MSSATPPPQPDTTGNLLRSLDYSVLQQCMHCGMCLPTCPTYVETGRERHSPRGRIALMRAIADGELEVNADFGEEMYYCLGCLACTTACPAGVDYPNLFETARAEIERKGVLDTRKRRSVRWFALRLVFTRPRLLRAIGRLLWLWQASGLQSLSRRTGLTRLLPGQLADLEPQTPRIQRHFSDALINPVERPAGPTRHRVAVLTGCVQDLAFSDVNRATVEVLLANGCEVITPRAQACCGSLHAHNGDTATARELARRQIDAIDPDSVDAIISNAGGCGSHLRHYDHLLADDPVYAARAVTWSRKLRDIHEWLAEIGFRRPAAPADSPASEPQRVTYHESCHLCHGQKVSRQPREILRALPGVELRECAEATWCCGSAGIYNITQPETAAWLQTRKIGHVQATGASVVATANPGCHLQLENGLKRATPAGSATPSVVHPIVLLAQAYAAEAKATGRASK
jgi:glycolate oxidase iron-sulfur subunit